MPRRIAWGWLCALWIAVPSSVRAQTAAPVPPPGAPAPPPTMTVSQPAPPPGGPAQAPAQPPTPPPAPGVVGPTPAVPAQAVVTAAPQYAVTKTSAETEPTTQALATQAPVDVGRFEFGSYGRIGIASDGRGGTGRDANIVAHGTRIDEDSYAELELRREDTFLDQIKSKVVATLALYPPFFHFSGNPTQNIALRNLYAQAIYGDWNLWIGSRMYRGDDIYLLDWWPLDNQNTVGGGAGWKSGDTTIAAHVGMQRLDNSYQYETLPSTTPFGLGATTVTQMDRPRTIETLKATQLIRNSSTHHLFDSDKAGFKAILYGEAHEISAGVYKDPNTSYETAYPADTGWMVGGELAYWTGERDTFVQLFVRYAHGLAAYDPLAAPTSFAQNLTTGDAHEAIVALGGNWERGSFGLLYGGYLREFRDGSPVPVSFNHYDEGTLVLRPQLFLGQHWGVAAEGSYQAQRYELLDPETGKAFTPQLWRAGLMPYFSPSGRGSFKRPQLRLIYAVTFRDAAAKELYAPGDVFSQRNVEHYLGLQAEWWFNSSSYP
jgi:maltoporin